MNFNKKKIKEAIMEIESQLGWVIDVLQKEDQTQPINYCCLHTKCATTAVKELKKHLNKGE